MSPKVLRAGTGCLEKIPVYTSRTQASLSQYRPKSNKEEMKAEGQNKTAFEAMVPRMTFVLLNKYSKK
jgi:hypothetical protein